MFHRKRILVLLFHWCERTKRQHGIFNWNSGKGFRSCSIRHFIGKEYIVHETRYINGNKDWIYPFLQKENKITVKLPVLLYFILFLLLQTLTRCTEWQIILLCWSVENQETQYSLQNSSLRISSCIKWEMVCFLSWLSVIKDILKQ